jgi:hypothetical protein
VALLAVGAARAGDGATGAVLEDAERMAALLAGDELPSVAMLQSAYLDPGTAGVRIFTPGRIEDATNLHAAIAGDPAAYRRAADFCLPVLRDMQPEVSRLIERVGEIVLRADTAQAYVVFGAGNSGGTADERGLVLGLEVVCRSKETREAVAAGIREFVAHEMAHVHQARAGVGGDGDDLLRQALVEGFADFVMRRALPAGTQTDAERSSYGTAHEAELWRAFEADVAGGRADTEWLYRPVQSRPGQPADMGYWIGLQICEAYYGRAADKAAAMRTLLELKDPRAILEASGYAARWNARSN